MLLKSLLIFLYFHKHEEQNNLIIGSADPFHLMQISSWPFTFILFTIFKLKMLFISQTREYKMVMRNHISRRIQASYSCAVFHNNSYTGNRFQDCICQRNNPAETNDIPGPPLGTLLQELSYKDGLCCSN